MARQDEPSYTDLVYEVLRSAGRPLTFQEIFDQVNCRRPVATRDPKGTIRNALTQGRQLVSIGDGRYGYLPQLVKGSLLRVLLTEEKPADHALIYPVEVRQALWPSFFESKKRTIGRPFQATLANGKDVLLSLEFFGHGVWGTTMPEGLRRYLTENNAARADSLLIRVDDGEASRGQAWVEARRKRDEAKVTRRNRELADATLQILWNSRSREVPIWDIVCLLLARGLYRSDVAPDPLESVLKADRRFVYVGLDTWIPAEMVTPDVQETIRRRHKLDAQMKKPKEETKADFGDAPSLPALRHRMERIMSDLRAMLSEREFGSIQEANAFVQEMLAKGGVPRRRAETPLEKAQDLMYQAWEASNPRERVRLARKALEMSPDCSDAYVLLAEETARGAKEAADLYAKGVAAGERALGRETFEQGAGHFWGIIETRPYMRARAGLAQALWAMGKRQEAIEHIWDMLRLNPGDNQGIRYLLLNWLLASGEDARVKELLKRYPDDISAVWQYGVALLAYRTEGDTKRARKLLAEAERENPYVPPYLLGRKRLPSRLPELISLGDETEAIACATEQMAVWRETPGALAWLDRSLG
ncbi:MAG: hypothetical protein HY675_28135 [Chloroflexi bacterium]|nr:hypothetical protein [Chloroflexota bacterium]